MVVAAAQAFTSVEYADMVFAYGEAQGIAAVAAMCYCERYPNMNQPSVQIFGSVFWHLCETGTVQVKRANTGTQSTCAIVIILGISNWSVWIVFHEQQSHAYHPQRVKVMDVADFPLRVEFCERFLAHISGDVSFDGDRFASAMKLPSLWAACQLSQQPLKGTTVSRECVSGICAESAVCPVYSTTVLNWAHIPHLPAGNTPLAIRKCAS
ncbi:hypothetical protein PR048_006195 [Dryococelus australis]|uniref:DUF4817 domain-containing protein n=1 Tax=Dryococelus australis TaxID=614101 RepID=A0ABQ9IA93_9NEOP|nr:hypothetical protein PR048_006195 [Dryococelus australis]